VPPKYSQDCAKNYVLLSRVTSLDNLLILRDFSKDVLRTEFKTDLWTESQRLQTNKLVTDQKYAVLFSQFVTSKQGSTPQSFGKSVQLFIKEDVIFDQFDAGKTVEVRALTKDLQKKNIVENDIIEFRHKNKSIFRKVLSSSEFASIEIMFQTRLDIQPKDCLPNLSGDAQKVIDYYYEKRYVSSKTRVVAFKLGLLTSPSGSQSTQQTCTQTTATSSNTASSVSVTPVEVTTPGSPVLPTETVGASDTSVASLTTASTVSGTPVEVTIPGSPVLPTETVGASDTSVPSLTLDFAVKTTIDAVIALTPVKPAAAVGSTAGTTRVTAASISASFTPYESRRGCPPLTASECLMCLAGLNCKDLRHVKTVEVDPSATSVSPIQEQALKRYRTS